MLLQTSTSVQSKATNQPIKRTFGSVVSFTTGSVAEPQPKLKFVPFQLQNLVFWWHHFCQIMKIFVPEIPLFIQHTFKLILDTIYMMRQKVYRNKFLQYLEISKRNFTDILWILCAHNIIVTIRLACSVLKLSILHLMPRSDFCVLKLGLQMSENRMKIGWKTTPLISLPKKCGI